MQRLRVLIAASAAACVAMAIHAAPAGPARVGPGAPFPPLRLQVLRPGATGASPLELSGVIGRKPVLICYVALGEPFGEEALKALQGRAAGEWKGTVEVLGALRLPGGTSHGQARERLSRLGVELPVVIDEDFALGGALGVTTSPSFSLVDQAGILRIADGRSLKQELPAGGTLEHAVGSAARGGNVPTVVNLPRYYPAVELVGQPAPDFVLQQFQGSERLKLSDRLAAGGGKKMVALLFWHPNCKHCKQAMPGIMTGWKTYQQYIDLFSVVALKNEDEVVNARDTIRAHGMTFPVLQDEGRRVTELYKVVSTPTMVFVRPDGRVESVYTKGDVNYVPVFSAKLRSILGVASRLSGSRPKSKSP